MGVLFLVLIAVGIWLVPDLRSQPAWLLGSVLVLLGAAGLAWRQWLAIRSDQAMIDLERRKR